MYDFLNLNLLILCKFFRLASSERAGRRGSMQSLYFASSSKDKETVGTVGLTLKRYQEKIMWSWQAIQGPRA